MKPYPLSILAMAGLAAVAMALMPASSRGQAGAEMTEAAMESLVIELAAQQTVLQENQIKLDAKVAEIAEQVRQARLFVSRGGGSSPAK